MTLPVDRGAGGTPDLAGAGGEGRGVGEGTGDGVAVGVVEQEVGVGEGIVVPDRVGVPIAYAPGWPGV